MKVFDSIASALEKYRRAAGKRGYVCDDCGREIFSYPKERLCAECRASLIENGGNTCIKCGRKTFTEGVCLDCKRDLPLFSRGISPFVYSGNAARLLNRLKNGERYLRNFFGDRMSAALRAAEGLPESALLLPVPLSRDRECARGYNQAAELAKVVSEITDLEMRTDVLEKVKEVPPQKGLSRRERAENVLGAYRVKNKAACKGRTVVVIDDIMTTGATGSECARILFCAGASEVIFLTSASVPERK